MQSYIARVAPIENFVVLQSIVLFLFIWDSVGLQKGSVNVIQSHYF